MSSINATKSARSSKLGVETILSHRLGFSVLLSIVAVYYLFLLSNGTFQIFAPEQLDKAFDSMAIHLLHGEFTVDREAIGYEAFTRNGETYAYFGIFPAALRLLAIPFIDVARAELARLSCLTAVVIFVALQLRMLLIVHHSVPVESRGPEFLVIMVAATVLSGPQLYILGSAWIYHEPILWSAAIAAGFNLIIVRTTFGAKALRRRDLVLLASLAGLALNTRAPIGVALYLGTSLLVAWIAWCRNALSDQLPMVGKVQLSLTVLPPIAVLGLAAMVAGLINFERWGDALTFADFHDYDMKANVYTNLNEVLHNYGEFNVGRIWIGALYYATGIPYFLKDVPPFAEFLHARIMGGARIIAIEGPPITPVLTNPITIVLAGIGLYRVFWKPDIGTRDVTILHLVLIGHASAVFLILAAMTYTMRYRFDFAPFMTLAALVGYRSVLIVITGAREFWTKRMRIGMLSLCFLGIISSHYLLLIHKVWSHGVPMEVRLSLYRFVPFASHELHPILSEHR
jgi:hypothetical protein